MFISQIANVKNIWHPGVKDVDRTLVDLGLSNNKHMMFFLSFFFFWLGHPLFLKIAQII